jgi:hypothetical protein
MIQATYHSISSKVSTKLQVIAQRILDDWDETDLIRRSTVTNWPELMAKRSTFGGTYAV